MKEAFEKMTGMPDAWTNPALMVSRNAFIQGWEAALAQPAPVQEPVAWMYEDMMGLVGVRVQKEKPIVVRPVTPLCLCTPPAAQPAQEPLCPDCKAKVLYECVACSKNNYPQQRHWVGLTEEDKETLILKHAPPLHPDYKDDSLHGLLQAANDFLRELNT